MQHRTTRLLFLLAAASVTSGCLNSLTVVKLRPDGSGTIEQSVLVNAAMAESLASLAGQMAGAAGEGGSTPPRLPTPRELMDEARLKEAATRFGRGVRYVSSTPIKEGALEGSRAVFSFDDINALSVDQSPDAATRSHRDRVGFKLEKQPNGASLLTINFPDDARARAGDRAPKGAENSQVPPEALALVRPFLEGLRVGVVLDVDGTLVKTNAEHVAGKRITLVDVNFNEILKDPAAFQKLSTVGAGAGIGDLKPALKGVPGIKINTAETLTIELR